MSNAMKTLFQLGVMGAMFDSMPSMQVAKPKEVKKGHIGSIRLQPGQHFYELNTKTFLITVVDPQKIVTLFGDVKSRFEPKDDCLYTVAINVKNAEKKFMKMLDNARTSTRI